MAEKSTYWELLRRPEWQEKRLRIMERAGFKCEQCEDKETTLNVHHKYYTKGAKPWEYPNESLICLCEPCHEEWHYQDAEFKASMAKLSLHRHGTVRGFVQGLLLHQAGISTGEASGPMPGPDEFDGFLSAYGLEDYHTELWAYLLPRAKGMQVSHRILMDLYEKHRMGNLNEMLQKQTSSEGR